MTILQITAFIAGASLTCYLWLGWHYARRDADHYRERYIEAANLCADANRTIRQLSAALRVRSMTVVPRPPRERIHVN